jgi:hypothetical protein
LALTRRLSAASRPVALATGVIAALAIAAPGAEASAATPVSVPLPAFADIPAFVAPLLSSLGPSSRVAMAGTAIGDVFNGGTTVVVSAGPVAGSTNASP